MNHFKFVIWLALLAILASCDPTRYRPETRSLKLESLEPEVLTAPPGGSSTVVAILSSDSGFNGKVEFSLGSAPGWVSVDPKEVEVSLPPRGSRSVPLTLALSQEAVNGEYLLQVRAIYEKGWSNKDLRLRVSSDSTVSRPLRIERVEWGQTILLSNHALVGGKEALLRVHLVANEPLSLSRSLAGKVYLNGQVLGELFFSCPNPIPTETRQEDIASTCRVLLPKEWVVPGVVVELEMDPDNALSDTRWNRKLYLFPEVKEGHDLYLTIVPVVYKGVEAYIPDFEKKVWKVWPIREVRYSVRTPYTYRGTLGPSDTWGWTRLLEEISVLRMVDGSKRYYYGFVRIDYSSGIGGMGLIGGPVAVGYDSPFGGPDIMAHELGHNFGRLHAPCGGAQDVDQNYPYDGGKTGVWGYDLQYGTLVSPEEADIMGYCGYRFVSDYNYYGAWHFLDKNPPQDDKGFQNMELREERVLISGWIDIEGEVHFNPTLVVRAKPEGKKSADYKIILDGSEEYPVYVLEDSEGGVHFRSIVPPGKWRNVSLTLRGREIASLRENAQAQPLGLGEPEVEAKEEGDWLYLSWSGYEYASVFYLSPDGRRVALGMWHAGGKTALSTKGLPSGGKFEVQFSNGLEVKTVLLNRNR